MPLAVSYCPTICPASLRLNASVGPLSLVARVCSEPQPADWLGSNANAGKGNPRTGYLIAKGAVLLFAAIDLFFGANSRHGDALDAAAALAPIQAPDASDLVLRDAGSRP
jgi:hypothetical protein